MSSKQPSERRHPDAFRAHLRDLWFGAAKDDPAMSLRSAPGIGRIWSSTCRVIDPRSRDAIGSGFFIEGGAEGVVAVTNAHVVHGHRVVGLEWVDGPEMGGCSAELIAIDYSHDLAIVKPSMQTLQRLKLAGAVHPGEQVWLCGYPHGVDTPRVAKAVVAGYDVYVAFGRETAAMVLDGSVNPGNSGGPVCDANEDVVGVVRP